MNIISIIIPVYNAEATLRKCVESIVYGEERSVEVILVEDCSKDNSWELCVELEQEFSQVKCYKNDKNRGVSYSRNLGLEKASGKYILFVDSDDWVSGHYIKKMKEMVIKYPDFFVLCGYYYYDNIAGLKKKYLWDDYEKEIILNRESFFELLRGVLLQQLWNKIFCRDIIESNSVRFDESQSMGEDFQFVLDYMQAARIEKCIIFNEPLYYYIRSTNVSLMSKFGLIENENEFERLRKLKNICGADNLIVEQQYQDAVRNTKSNYIYQVCRNNSIDKEEKVAFIENIVKDRNVKLYIKEQKKIIAKEKIVQILNEWRILKSRVEGRIKRERRDKIAKKACQQLKATGFTIISQNCIGGVFYYDMHMQYLSPTIGLFFKEPDFIKFVENLEYYINLELDMQWQEEYPVGKLEDVKVYFMHYNTCREAKDAWDRRKKRINWEKIIVLATDTEEFDEDVWRLWSQITYPKVLFTVSERKSSEVVIYPEYKELGSVPNLIPDREFYKGGVLISTVNKYN